MDHRRKIFISCFLLLFLQGLHASLFMEIRLLSYEHDCEEGTWLWKSECDPTFTFCIDRPTENIEFNDESCQYSFVDESQHFQDEDSIDFQAIWDKRGVPVPWKFTVDKIWDSQILFAVDIHDDDLLFDDDMVTLANNMTLTIAATELEARYTLFEMHPGYHSFKYEIRLYCAGNFYGKDCQTYCLASSDDSGHYICEPGTGRKICLKGWKGEYCNVDINECDLKLCRRGNCVNSPGDYECHCPDYFSGRHCTIMTNPCGSNPCQMGSLCLGDPQDFTYTCHCISGWEGAQCDIKSDPCKENPCTNDGDCESTGDKFSYTCHCLSGWKGKDCDQRVDPCDSSPCMNGGTCNGELEHQDYTCTCRRNFTGMRCESEIFDEDNGALLKAKSSSMAWLIPVAVAPAVLLTVIVVILVLWRKRRGKSKQQCHTGTLPPVVVFDANGTEKLAFENHAYTQANMANQDIERGRRNHIVLPPPTTHTRDDVSKAAKSCFGLDDENSVAVGGACNGEDCSHKKTGPKGSDTDYDNMDETDLRFSKVSTLSKRPISDRADENPYQDFQSLSKTQPGQAHQG